MIVFMLLQVTFTSCKYNFLLYQKGTNVFYLILIHD